MKNIRTMKIQPKQYGLISRVNCSYHCVYTAGATKGQSDIPKIKTVLLTHFSNLDLIS